MKPIWIWTITVLLTLFMVLGTLLVDARADTLCGPLCLQRVAALRGEPSDIDEFLAEGVGAEMTLADLVRAGGGTAVKCRLSELTYPAICHLWTGHFVVAEGPGKFWDEGVMLEKLDDYSGFAVVYGPVPGGDDGVDLRLKTYRWDIGVVTAGEVLRLNLGMRNAGSGELKVFEGVGSCSCLRLEGDEAVFDSSDQIGVQSKRLTLKSNDFVGDVVLQVTGLVLPSDLNHYPEVLRFGPGVTERRLWWNGATVKGLDGGIVRYSGPRPWKGTLKVETVEFGIHEIEMVVEANVWVSPRSVFFGDETSVDVVVGGPVAGVECPLPVKVSGNRVTVSLGDRRGLVQENLRIRVGEETLNVPVFGLVK